MPNTEQAARYREIRRLGAGGMATVTLAEDTVLGRQVALKRVYGAGDSRGILRLKREAMVGASLNHPNLVFVYDARLEDDGDVVIVMEYVEGETLADRIKARGPLPPEEALPVLRGVAAALDAIHEQGIVHRDVKPANVLLGTDGAVKLADLGVADVADRTRITSAGAVVGSFSYMAAEQLDGAAPSPAMDVYALGAVAFEMLAGERARPESNPLALAHAISTQSPPDLRRASPAAPAAAAGVLRRAMSADPAERPRSPGELVRRLESAFAPETSTQSTAPLTGPATAQVAAPKPARRRRSSILAPALLMLAALGVAAVLVVILTGAGKQSAGGTPTAHSITSPTSRSTASSSAHSTASTPAHSTASTSAHSTASTPSRSTATNTSTAAAPAAPTTSAGGSSAPAAAVEQFYTDAAKHDYAAAWALADPTLRNQLGGYPAFQNEMSSVRSISFHRAQVLSGGGVNAATVAVQTTSVQTDRTQQCSGTARTVRGGAGWVLDGISISCA